MIVEKKRGTERERIWESWIFYGPLNLQLHISNTRWQCWYMYTMAETFEKRWLSLLCRLNQSYVYFHWITNSLFLSLCLCLTPRHTRAWHTHTNTPPHQTHHHHLQHVTWCVSYLVSSGSWNAAEPNPEGYFCLTVNHSKPSTHPVISPEHVRVGVSIQVHL